MAEHTTEERSVEELYNAIIAEYEYTKSIAQIAKKLHTTQVRVQRVLITEGLWTSKRTEQIAELRAQGLKVNQIAEQLGKDVKTIQTFLPYSRGQYGRCETSDAARSKEYRDRMHIAAEKMMKKEKGAMDKDGTLNNDKIIFLEKAYQDKASAEHTEDMEKYIEDKEKNNRFLSNTSVFRLKLELVDYFLYGGNEDLGMEDEERKEFLRLAKAEKGIIREVLVPGSMNLHSMHFMIQRLFGWQNSHLHHFSISQSEFDRLTGGTIGGWERLCGSLLHYPDGETGDMYWDDDYKEGQSVKSWFKKKYCGPYMQRSVSDTYFDTQNEIHKFRSRFTQFTDDMVLEEMHHHVVMEEALNYLSEKLTLDKLLLKKLPEDGKKREWLYKSWLDRLDGEIQPLDDELIDLESKKREALEFAAAQLKVWRYNRHRVDEMKYFGGEAEVKRMTGMTSKKWLKESDEAIPFFENECLPLFRDYNPEITPITDTLYYEYDYGDGWCVKITVLDKYSGKTNADFSKSDLFAVDIMTEKDALQKYRYFSDGEEVDENLREVLAYVDVKEHPRCVAADGLNVLDDVGGLGGFEEMLSTLKGNDPDKKESMREWARGMGWTGRMIKPENIL